MSLIDEIKKSLTPELLSKVASSLGVSEDQAGKAAGAAVPSMLAGVSQLAQSGDGANKLATALKGIDLSALGDPLKALSGGGLGDLGGKMLSGLFGGGLLGKLGDAIGKFTGLGDKAGKLLGVLAPFVMGGLAKKWMGGGAATPQGLNGLLNSEKGNIAAAMPAGLSLGNMFTAPDTPAAPAGGGGLLKILLPILALLGVGVAVYFLFFNKPPALPTTPKVEVPGLPEVKMPDLSGLSGEAKTVGESLTSTFGDLTTTFGTIKDGASADEAMKKIPDLSTKVTAAKGLFDKLPAGDMKSKLVEFVKAGLSKIKVLFEGAKNLPGVGDKLKPVQGLLDSVEGFTK